MRLLFACLLLATMTAARAETPPRAATAEETALLQESLKNSDQDTEHWAYTETITVRDKKGKVREEQVVRFDPSKPYAEQFTPLSIDGRPPTERQLKKYRKQGQQRGDNLMLNAGRKRKGRTQMHLNDATADIDFEHPLVAGERDGRIVYEIPLRSPDHSLPAEKFQLQVQVDPRSRLVAQVDFRIRDSFRVKLVARIKRGEMHMIFAVVDPSFGPVITSMQGDLGAAVLLIPFQATFSGTRTDWQRVKAYDERFSVKLGPLQFPGF